MAKGYRDSYFKDSPHILLYVEKNLKYISNKIPTGEQI